MRTLYKIKHDIEAGMLDCKTYDELHYLLIQEAAYIERYLIKKDLKEAKK